LRGCTLPIAVSLLPAAALAAEPPATSVAATGYYYAMRDEPDFAAGVATLDHASWHLEARYNYEARNAGSAFVGWKFRGGEAITFEVTPIVGALFGAARGVVPTRQRQASRGARSTPTSKRSTSTIATAPMRATTTAWSELAWKPVEWLRVGLVGQRTHTVDTGRDLQRGVFARPPSARPTLGAYAFNPDSGARYVIVSLGARF
jgi:hypothetical protein